MEITLITLYNIPISIGVGRHCFGLDANKMPMHDDGQRIGSEVKGTSHIYNEAFELAVWAMQHKLYDRILDNTRYL